MLGLTSLEVFLSNFNTNTTNKIFEIFTDNFDKFSFEDLKAKLKEDLSTSEITPYHLQH